MTADTRRFARRRGFDNVLFLADKESGREYRRVACGLSWPFENWPGWLVAVGEDRNAREDGKRHLAVIHEWKAVGPYNSVLPPLEIMAEATALHGRMAKFPMFISPLELPDASLLPLYNRGLSRHDTRLALRTPPRYGPDAHIVYDRLLERMTDITASGKRLHFGQGGMVAGEAARITLDDKLKPLENFPAVAALLYALAWLVFVPGDGACAPEGRFPLTTGKAGY